MGRWFTSKKELRQRIEELEATNKELNVIISNNFDSIYGYEKKLDAINKKYPFEFGQVVYDVQLRNEKGRFTKTKPSKVYSTINEVVVDKKNYFNIVDRYNANDVFTTRDAAIDYLDDVCID